MSKCVLVLYASYINTKKKKLSELSKPQKCFCVYFVLLVKKNNIYNYDERKGRKDVNEAK